MLSFMQFCVVTVYAQALLSKLHASGLGWLRGDIVWVDTVRLGTPLGRWLTQFRWLFPVLAMATVAFEAVLPVVFLVTRRPHVLVNAAAIAFHLGTFAVLGISFWRLWGIYPFLFSGMGARTKTEVTEHSRPLKPWHRRTLGAVLICFLGLQVAHTMTGATNLIFYPYAMFSSGGLLRHEVHARLIASDGTSIEVDGDRTLPADFYKTNRLILFALQQSNDSAERFSRLVLDWLNRAPWSGLDETYASVRPPPGSSFVAIEWQAAWVDYSRYVPGQPLVPISTRVLFRSGPPGT